MLSVKEVLGVSITPAATRGSEVQALRVGEWVEPRSCGEPQDHKSWGTRFLKGSIMKHKEARNENTS